MSNPSIRSEFGRQNQRSRRGEAKQRGNDGSCEKGSIGKGVFLYSATRDSWNRKVRAAFVSLRDGARIEEVKELKSGKVRRKKRCGVRT